MDAIRSLLPAFFNTLAIYVLLIVGIRTLGRRQTGQLTALDLLIILLLGSAVETALIGPSPKPSNELFHDPNTSLAAGLVSAGTLLLANATLGRLIRRSKWLRHLIAGGPLLLVHDGQVVQENLRRAGLTEEDLRHALRGRGFAEPSEVRCALLEPNGEIDAVDFSAPPGRSPGIPA
jgi:uncharacterized membrane protein YcaP (DUF421 family)